ncbi:hypothetical protein QJQ45_004245 [Haematococcus lacustris]|nr:hypothetical protein QJQ45_004245 [Haematococcus lacustris]
MDQFVVRGISAADAADNLHRELLMHDEQRFQMSLDRQAAMIEKRLPGTTNFGPSPRLNLAASPSTPPPLARTGKAYENCSTVEEALRPSLTPQQRVRMLCVGRVAALVVVLCLAIVAGQQTALVPQQPSAHKLNKETALAPEAELINNIDDIDSAGEGSVSDACREDVYQFKIQRSTNINLNVPLARACKVDVEQHCNITWFFGYRAGQVITCLRDVKDLLAPACKRQVFAIQKDAAEDYRADAALYEACKDDATKLCSDVKLGGGRVQACLALALAQALAQAPVSLPNLSPAPAAADDIRLSVRLYKTCLKAKKRFCANVEPGAARVKDCLEQHRNEAGFDPACKAEVDDMIAHRVRDLKLDNRLRKSCELDIMTTCSAPDMHQDELDEASVVNCLQDFLHDIQVEACRKQVLKYQELAAEDIRFNPSLATACSADRQAYCANVPPGSARVIRCLMEARGRLSAHCKAVLFGEEVRFSSNIDFQYPMKKACTAEMSRFCKDVAHGDAQMIRCLQQNKHQQVFSKACREEVQLFEQEATSDYRLNARLATACVKDISQLCPGQCQAQDGEVCGGRVLRCLIEQRASLTSPACQQEVLYFAKMEVSDYRNDVILALACRADVDRLCGEVEPGEGRVHQCLRAHHNQLSEDCRKEELLLEELEAESVELQPGLMKVCKDERSMFCQSVVPGGARMFRCLAEKMGDSDFGEQCRDQVLAKLKDGVEYLKDCVFTIKMVRELEGLTAKELQQLADKDFRTAASQSQGSNKARFQRRWSGLRKWLQDKFPKHYQAAREMKKKPGMTAAEAMALMDRPVESVPTPLRLFKRGRQEQGLHSPNAQSAKRILFGELQCEELGLDVAACADTLITQLQHQAGAVCGSSQGQAYKQVVGGVEEGVLVQLAAALSLPISTSKGGQQGMCGYALYGAMKRAGMEAQHPGVEAAQITKLLA